MTDKKHLFISVIVFLILFLFSSAGLAQQNRLLEADNPAGRYISNLQHHGYLLDLNPTAMPYTHHDIEAGLNKIDSDALHASQREWVNLLRGYVQRNRDVEDEPEFGVNFTAGSYITGSERQSVLRPLGDVLKVYPRAGLSGYIESENFIARANIRHSLYYDQSPDAVDAANRLYIRSEDAYLGYNGKWLRVYAGRFKNQWGPYEEASTILSTNPYSFDQINIRFGGEKFSFTSVFGELDNIGADSTYTGSAFTEGSKRRYFVGHRFDWRPTPTFGVAVWESVIYSGQSSGLSLKYLNPLHVHTFVTENSPKNDENNLQIGGMLWSQWRGFTFNIQFTLDDLHLQRYDEKDNFAITSSIYKTDLFRGVDAGIEVEAVTHQTYVSEQPEGRYVYLKRGLATQFNDYILTNLYTNIHSFKNLTVSPGVQWLLQGEQTINQLQLKTYQDGRRLETILTGTEAQTVRPGVSFHYRASPAFWIEGDVGVNLVSDLNHQPGATDTRFTGFLQFGFDFSLL